MCSRVRWAFDIKSSRAFSSAWKKLVSLQLAQLTLISSSERSNIYTLNMRLRVLFYSAELISGEHIQRTSSSPHLPHSENFTLLFPHFKLFLFSSSSTALFANLFQIFHVASRLLIANCCCSRCGSLLFVALFCHFHMCAPLGTATGEAMMFQSTQQAQNDLG